MKYAPLSLKYSYGSDLVEEYCPPNCGGPPRLPDGRVQRKEWKDRGQRSAPAPRSSGKPAEAKAPESKTVEGAHSWKKAKTTDDAKNQLKTLLPGVRVAVLTSRTDPPAYKTRAMAHLNSIGEQTTHLRNNFPAIDKMLQDKQQLRIIKVGVMEKAGAVRSSTLGSWQKSAGLISLNVYTMASGNGDIKIGSFHTDGSNAGTFRHELGHAFHDSLGIDHYNKWTGVLGKLPRTKTDPKDEWFKPGAVKKLVSQYAATNYREAFAESFAAYTSPKYGQNGKRLPKSIEDYFGNVLGRAVHTKAEPGWVVESYASAQDAEVSCQTCVHFDGEYSCEAYPNGVPMSLYLGLLKHTQVLNCQVGELTWEGSEVEESKFGEYVVESFCPPNCGGGKGVEHNLSNVSEKELTAWGGKRAELATAAYSEVMHDESGHTKPIVIRNKEGKVSGIAAVKISPSAPRASIVAAATAKSDPGAGLLLFKECCRLAVRENKGLGLMSLPSATGFYKKIGMLEFDKARRVFVFLDSNDVKRYLDKR